ncbi:COX15/CtaA family protein [Paenibacillus lautus]|uniref:COX15/CtaA family protein n=1 Tax=Paenibacillus lautus TaxID=1401 RepID=UPI003D2C6226
MILFVVSLKHRLLVWSSFIGMFLVLLAGALVTKTGSGLGCGDDWPLCNGKFIPAYTLESMIEYSHRMITGVVGILVLATYIVIRKHYRGHREASYYAGGTLLFTVIQALMGAAAVMWPQQPAVMALHFGISLFAVASSMLLVVWMRGLHRAQDYRTNVTVPRSIRFLGWGIWLYSCGVVYLGAYIRHTESEAGCMGWPLCNGQVIPYLGGASGIVFLHRVAAAVLLILLILLLLAVKNYETRVRSTGLTTLVIGLNLVVLAQILSGAWLTLAMNNHHIFIFASLVHNVLATLLFSMLAVFGIRTWKSR